MKIDEIQSEIASKGIKLLIVRGISGSGKSTFSRSFGDFKHFEADMFFMRDGKYMFDGGRLGAAHGWCQNSVQKELMSGGKVVVSNTFTTHREIKPYVEMAKSLGVAFMVIKCVGKWRNEHNVPEEVLEKMRDRWQNVDGEVVYEVMQSAT